MIIFEKLKIDMFVYYLEFTVYIIVNMGKTKLHISTCQQRPLFHIFYR
jgi:hypothetical protein